jgi:galactose mutarotase-like enzyme
VSRRDFGHLPDGRPVGVLRLGSPPGPVLDLLDLGAAVHRLEITAADGSRRNVVRNLDSPTAYLGSSAYLGVSVGRYANRIAGGRFVLDGQPVSVGVNDRGNHLHGGPDGFDRRLWTVEQHGPDGAVLALVSPDGDQGFPGELRVRATFRTTPDSVRVEYEATTDRATVVNLTNHAYFNLDGDTAGTVDAHVLQVAADRYTPVDAAGIPTGELADVEATPFDLRRPRALGPAVRSDHEQVRAARGIDHNLVLRGDPETPAAVLSSPASGIRLELFTDRPGLQVYTGNFLDGTERSAAGRLLRQGDGIALEPQLFPDTPNHPEFGSARLAPGQTYRAWLEWRFSAAG